MESGGRFNSHQPISNDARAPRSVIEEAGGGERGGSMRKAEEYMPIANIMRIMRRILPSQAKVADDAKETIQECVTEFMSYITSEANARCHSECRKTITAEDVVGAMGALGFHDYVYPLTLFLHNYRAQDPHRRPMLPPPPRHTQTASSPLDFGLFK
ncbi:nuclear transcription factor Y subunit B-6-like [Salvia miltiorrhiza]|uniref:nuclear transcription factor Y subunit B-6-like n=1 Tax=Salvia miltiorrhiza TaxID=226208 RepID=UPI0025AD958C|nr:nuclear transcription factor Y subunit B-6-like [Salvia miltiorrhiza]